VQRANQKEPSVRDLLGRNWWVVLIRGIAAIVFGILAIVWPAHTLVVLILLFGAYALVDGIFNIVAAIRAVEHHTHWLALLLEGILGIIVGLIAFFHPGIAAIAFVYFIAAWAIITGVLELYAAVRLRRELGGEILLVLGGLASVIFGILLAIFPGAGALTVIWILGIYALIFGAILVGLAFRLRSWHQAGGSSGAQQPATT
jgi:uncharacterized membrane protein HdeD (DUF308 family)